MAVTKKQKRDIARSLEYAYTAVSLTARLIGEEAGRAPSTATALPDLLNAAFAFRNELEDIADRLSKSAADDGLLTFAERRDALLDKGKVTGADMEIETVTDRLTVLIAEAAHSAVAIPIPDDTLDRFVLCNLLIDELQRYADRFGNGISLSKYRASLHSLRRRSSK